MRPITTYAGPRFPLYPFWPPDFLPGSFSLRGQKLKGILLEHLVLASVSALLVWLVCWMHFRARRRGLPLPTYRILIEFVGVAAIALTGHLGGFLSGVNGPG